MLIYWYNFVFSSTYLTKVMCVHNQQIEIAKTLYKLGIDIDVIERITHISGCELLNELRKDRK